MALQIVALLLAALILTRNLPLALRPFFAPPRERRLASAIVPIASVLLAVVILLVAMKTLTGGLISWPR